VAANVLAWGHVRMFSPFGMNRSPLGLAALRAQDPACKPPADDALLYGRDFATEYLLPLARSDLLVDGLHEQTEVVAAGRDMLLKGELSGDERGAADFRLLVRGTTPGDHARERFATADAVIDATGTFGHHNWLGPGGIAALGELAAAGHIEYGLPDVLGRDRQRYASRNVLLVGAGHSAATNLVALAELAGQAPDTWVTWVVRRACDDEKAPQPLAVMADDPLPERLRLARSANRLAGDDANHVTFLGGTTVEAVSWHADLARFSVRLAGKHAGEHEFDQIIANVGYHADSGIYRELQVGESPTAAAPRATGAQSLIVPEPDFYVLGAKSFGRDSRFLISDGLDQIRELFAIIGDRADLDLYATMAPVA
jgi:hypothetical protein